MLIADLLKQLEQCHIDWRTEMLRSFLEKARYHKRQHVFWSEFQKYYLEKCSENAFSLNEFIAQGTKGARLLKKFRESQNLQFDLSQRLHESKQQLENKVPVISRMCLLQHFSGNLQGAILANLELKDQLAFTEVSRHFYHQATLGFISQLNKKRSSEAKVWREKILSMPTNYDARTGKYGVPFLNQEGFDLFVGLNVSGVNFKKLYSAVCLHSRSYALSSQKTLEWLVCVDLCADSIHHAFTQEKLKHSSLSDLFRLSLAYHNSQALKFLVDQIGRAYDSLLDNNRNHFNCYLAAGDFEISFLQFLIDEYQFSFDMKTGLCWDHQKSLVRLIEDRKKTQKLSRIEEAVVRQRVDILKKYFTSNDQSTKDKIIQLASDKWSDEDINEIAGLIHSDFKKMIVAYRQQPFYRRLF